MPNIEFRLGVRRELPIRNQVEVAPPRLRVFLKKLYVDEFNTVTGYKRLAEDCGRIAEDVWDYDWAEPRFSGLIQDLDWIEIYELIEERLDGSYLRDEEINEILAREGIAYEIVDGKFYPYDPEGEDLGLDTENPIDSSDDKFAPVRAQFQRALSSLNSIPANNLAAIGEALNALEAVTQIISENPTITLGKAIGPLLGNEPHRKILASTIEKLYGYASQVPGARHGQHEFVDVGFPEASFAVRSAGAAIAMLIAEYRVNFAGVNSPTSLVL